MLDIDLLNATIHDLEQEDISLYNCQQLASLYIVRDHLVSSHNLSEDEKELRDILPEYKDYCEIKRKYQMHELSEESVARSMKDLCQEIKEFMLRLFASTDMPQERKQLRMLIETLSKEWN